MNHLGYEDDIYKYKEILLEKIKHQAALHLSPYLLDNLSVDYNMDFISEDIVLRLKAGIWKEDVAIEEHIVQYPATTWDMFLHSNQKNWLVKKIVQKYGINYKTKHVKFEKFAVYPEFAYAMPDKSGKAVIKYLVNEWED